MWWNKKDESLTQELVEAKNEIQRMKLELELFEKVRDVSGLQKDYAIEQINEQAHLY